MLLGLDSAQKYADSQDSNYKDTQCSVNLLVIPKDQRKQISSANIFSPSSNKINQVTFEEQKREIMYP